MSSRPHVVFVASSADRYGADRMLLASVRAVRGAGADVTVLVPERGPLVQRLTGAGAVVAVTTDYALRRAYRSPMGLVRVLAANLQAVALIARWHRLSPIAAVVTNTEAVVAGALAAFLLRRPHVWHVHEILVDPRWLSRGLAWVVARASDLVLVCSASARRNLEALEPRTAHMTRVVLNGIDMPEVPESFPQPPADDANGVVRFGCVARINAWKGHRELLVAFRRLVSDLPCGGSGVELHVFGEPFPGNERLVVELRCLAASLGLDELVWFHGHVDDHEEIYSSIDVLVVPSTSPEPFSLTCVEAQARGLPVIATADGGPSEIVVPGRTGILVDMGDPEALPAALRAMMDAGPMRRVWGREGRRHVRERFSERRYAADFVGELRGLPALGALESAAASQQRRPSDPTVAAVAYGLGAP